MIVVVDGDVTGALVVMMAAQCHVYEISVDVDDDDDNSDKMMMMRMRTGVVVGYWPSDGCLIPGLRDRRPPRGPVSVSNIHSIIHPGSSTTS